jgi:hypothetical protein
MNVAIFGSFGQRLLAGGWTKETAIAFFGGGDFDLTDVQPGPNAQLTAVAIFGSVDVRVAEGTQVTMSGASLLGSRKVKVPTGSGPELRVRGIAVFGHVDVLPPTSR